MSTPDISALTIIHAFVLNIVGIPTTATFVSGGFTVRGGYANSLSYGIQQNSLQSGSPLSQAASSSAASNYGYVGAP